MEIKHLLAAVDHTLLKPTATWEEIRQLCDEAAAFRCASVCIPPSYVKAAAEYLNGQVPVGTVVGFPNGYATTMVKVFETRDAVVNGAGEIDLVINLGWVKDGRWQALLEEIRAVRKACGPQVLKVIVETCLLTQEEKVRLCQIVSDGGADYIKTSTGFSTGGATREDVALMRQHVASHVKIKAAGGINSLEDGVELLELGAARLGSSRMVSLARAQGFSPEERESISHQA